MLSTAPTAQVAQLVEQWTENPCALPERAANSQSVSAASVAAGGRWRIGRKLTGADVVLIRELHVSGVSAGDLAARFGIHACTVHRVVGGATWRTTTGRQQAPQKARVAPEPQAVSGARWVPLAGGGFALVDEQDFASVSLHSWVRTTGSASRTEYAHATIGGANVKLHRFVWAARGLPLPGKIDHRDLDGLNCRFGNLRAATDSQNHGNRPLNSNSSTGFKGVSKYRGGYRAYIAPARKHVHLGYFLDAEAAARAYDAAAVSYFGEFARLNFPPDGYAPALGVRT